MFQTYARPFAPTEPRIAKRPGKKARVYRSRDYKRELEETIRKWTPYRVFKELYMYYDTTYNPFASDWFYHDGIERTRVMQARAEAMFDTKRDVLLTVATKLRNSKQHEAKIQKAFERAKKAALEEWARQQYNQTRIQYYVDLEKETILPVKK